MATFQPKWKVNDSSQPADSVYTTPDGGFSVTVGPQGLINVVHDDWLSKYELAIHGDLDPTDHFLRFTERGWVDIVNLDLIYEGEKLIHIPSFVAFHLWFEKIQQAKPMPNDISFPVDPTLLYDQIFDMLGNVMSTADILINLLEYTPLASALEAAAAAFSVVGHVFFVIEQTRTLIQAHEIDIQVEQIYASAYALTAWIFDDLYRVPPDSALRLSPIGSPLGPMIRFPVPARVADVDRWRDQAVARFSSNPDLQVRRRVDRWEEVSDQITGSLDRRANALVHSPVLPVSIEKYRWELQNPVIKPDPGNPGLNPGRIRLSRGQLYTAFINQLKAQFRQGQSSNLNLIRLIDRRARAFPPPTRKSTSIYP